MYFKFNTTKVQADFTEGKGVYVIKFSDDWNSILSISYLSDLPDNIPFLYTIVYKPTASNIGATNNMPNENCTFHAYWKAEFGLDTAIFYWNASGAMQPNGTITFNGEKKAWSNFTRQLPDQYSITIAWYIACSNIYGNYGNTSVQYLQVISYTELSVGWNNFTAWNVDIGKTLSQVNMSLALDNINWTTISLEYPNGSRAVLVWEQDTNEYIGQEDAVVESGCTFYIYCMEAGEWYHNYP